MASQDHHRTQGLKGSAGYTVLARRYRSRTFDELVGQEPIARTLQNAIASNRVAHAYLFCGTRGVGKTSAARIFAKALNASDDLSEKDAISDAILRGDDLDVIEIDGASNRGVQEARDLIAGASLSPTRCRYKIYIIDEVHMLTKDAFNALLKTMEEPPEHVKFILCTTEPQKVLATIQSRCQRFDFRAIPTSRIAEHLRTVLKAESIDAEDDVIVQVARLGNGSMRDALSLLDRLLAAGEPTLTSALLEQMLGLPDQQLVSDLMQGVVDGEPGRTLEIGAGLLARGSSVEQVLEMLAEHLRLMLVVRTCPPDSEVMEVSADARERVAVQAAAIDIPGIVHLIALCDATSRNAHGSANGRALFDAVLVRMCLAEQFADAATLLAGGVTGQQSSADSGHTSSLKKKTLTTASPLPPRRTPPSDVAPVPAIEDTPACSTTTEIKPAVDPADNDVPAIDGAALWETVREAAVGAPADEARVEHLTFRELVGNVLTLSIDPRATHADYLERNLESLIDQIARVSGHRLQINLIRPAKTTGSSSVAPAAQVSEARQLPRVRQAMEIFEADVIDVQQLDPLPQKKEN